MFFTEYIRILRRNKIYAVFIIPLFLIKTQMNFPCTKTIICFGEGNSVQGSEIYFVHGYYSSNSHFDNMINFLNDSGHLIDENGKKITPRYFDYFEKYLKLSMSKKDVHFIEGGISTYADNFYELLSTSHDIPTKIVIVAHSLGGIIVREMLRKYRTELERIGIQIVKVISLGVPHLGTELAINPLIKTFLDIVNSSWGTPVGHSLAPNSQFIRTLNENVSRYMNGIYWHFVAGVSLDLVSVLGQEIIYEGIPCDGFVDWKSALAIGLAVEPAIRLVLPKDHYHLINDPKDQESYKYIREWISGNKFLEPNDDQ
jgi:pimeloyl-ACP methyl ester carboxylesterase